MFSLNSNSDIEIYFQDLILESISNTADEQARLEIKQITDTLINLTDQLNNSSYAFHNLINLIYIYFSRSNPSDIEIIVSKLVHNFLFPTVQKILTRQQCKKHSLSE
jgi:hypothetical protein